MHRGNAEYYYIVSGLVMLIMDQDNWSFEFTPVAPRCDLNLTINILIVPKSGQILLLPVWVLECHSKDPGLHAF